MLLALMLAAAEPAAPPPTTNSLQGVGFTMSDTKYFLPVPQGYCFPDVYPPGTTGEMSNASGYIISKPAYFQRCDEAKKTYGDQDFILVKFLKNGTVNATDRQDFIASNAPAIQNEEFIRWLRSGGLLDKVEAKTEQDVGRTIAANASAQALGSDDTCIYNGSRMSVTDTVTGVTETAKMVSCTTIVDKTLVIIDIVGNEKRGESFPSLARKLKAVVNSLMKA